MNNPVERPNSAASTGDFEFSALQEARNYRAALIRSFSPYLKGRTIEVGAGIGQITGGLLELPAMRELVCVEPDPEFCRAFRSNHPLQRLVEGTFDQVSLDGGWDAILSVNVLEHIREDDRELAAYRQALQARCGNLCLFVPARPEIYAPIDGDFGHHRRYTRPGLRRKLEAAGFEIVVLRYFNFVGYFAWWLTFCVLRKRSFNVTSVRTFDRLIFPVVHALESCVCAPPFGQSLIAVARAKA